MKKLFLFLFPVILFASCNKDEVEEEIRHKMNTNIGLYLMDEGIGGVKVMVDEHKKTDLPLKEIKEYSRLNDSLIVFIERKEELQSHDVEGDSHKQAVAPERGGTQRCADHSELIKDYEDIIQRFETQISKIETAYTSKNYVVKAVLRHQELGTCTPVWFYFNERIEVMASYSFLDEEYSCQ